MRPSSESRTAFMRAGASFLASSWDIVGRDQLSQIEADYCLAE